jgi:hypothetical protein
MIVTEEEAKTKRCQESYAPPVVASPSGSSTSDLAYHSYAIGSLGAGYATVGAPAFCIGSACMAWRWFDNIDDQAIEQPRGYCGKAGKP